MEREEYSIAESSRDERRGGREEERKKARGEEDKTHAHAEKNENENVCACALVLAHFERVLEGGPSLSI
jgi:hypothetical protein